jgi:hypothetical protein
MLAVTVGKYTPVCATNAGGVSRIWTFDAADFDFTYTPGTGYTAVALMAGATVVGGSGFFPINFNYLEAEYKAPQTIKGTSVSYMHTLTLQVSTLSEELTDFMIKMQTASACGDLGFIIQLNNGTILVIGESIVNGDKLPRYRIIMDGSEMASGKAFDDNNGAALSFKGSFSKPAHVFTGGLAAIEALEAT